MDRIWETMLALMWKVSVSTRPITCGSRVKFSFGSFIVTLFSVQSFILVTLRPPTYMLLLKKKERERERQRKRRNPGRSCRLVAVNSRTSPTRFPNSINQLKFRSSHILLFTQKIAVIPIPSSYLFTDHATSQKYIFFLCGINRFACVRTAGWLVEKYLFKWLSRGEPIRILNSLLLCCFVSAKGNSQFLRHQFRESTI